MADLGEFGAAERDADPDVERDTFGFYGERFTVKQLVGAMPLLRFAKAAYMGADNTDMDGLAAQYDLIVACIEEDDLPRFEQTATKHAATADELMEVCAKLYRAISGRPTVRPSDSHSGRSNTGESSKDASSSDASLSPIQRDPRILELVEVDEAATRLAS